WGGRGPVSAGSGGRGGSPPAAPWPPPGRAAAPALDVIAGPDDRDRHSLPADVGSSYVEACDAGIAGMSVAWSPDLGHAAVDPDIADLCAAAAERFESLGCHVEVVTPTSDDPEEI